MGSDPTAALSPTAVPAVKDHFYDPVPALSAESVEVAANQQDIEAAIQPEEEDCDRSEAPVEHRVGVVASYVDGKAPRKGVPQRRYEESAGELPDEVSPARRDECVDQREDENNEHRHKVSLPQLDRDGFADDVRHPFE